MSKKHGIALLLDSESGQPLQPWLATRAVSELGIRVGKQRCQRIPSSSRSRARSALRVA
jgi:hypothetical protein